MDVGASFQFLVDALAREWYVIAPDLRGFGRSEWQPQGYWFHDYIADLEALRRCVRAEASASISSGHSLGGNVVLHYAGVRPARVRRVVSLDGFGIPAEDVRRGARERSAKWLDALARSAGFRAVREPRRGRRPAAEEQSAAAARQGDVPRGALGRGRCRTARARLASDPRHKLPFPTVYRMEEMYAIMAARSPRPTLWVAAAESNIPSGSTTNPRAKVPPTSRRGQAPLCARAARPSRDDRRRRPHAASRSAARRCRGDRSVPRALMRRLRVRSRRGAYAALAVLTVVWGSNWVVMKFALRNAHPVIFNIERTWVAVAVLFFVLIAQRRPLLA